jgi:hypothetical protein
MVLSRPAAVGLIEQHQSIRPDPEPAVAKETDLFYRQIIISLIAIVQYHEIIARALVFMKTYFHRFMPFVQQVC